MPFFKVFWYDSIQAMNPRSTNCEADALTTTPSRRLIDYVVGDVAIVSSTSRLHAAEMVWTMYSMFETFILYRQQESVEEGRRNLEAFT